MELNFLKSDAEAQESYQRKQEALKRLDYYYDEQQEYLLDSLKTHFSEPERFSLLTINICQKIIDGLSTVYIQPANREVSQDQNQFKKIAKQADLDIRLKQANRLSKLLGTVLIKPVYRKGQIKLDILTGDILDIETDASPEDIKSITITKYPESGKRNEITYSKWTASHIYQLNANKKIISYEPNPYQVLPFVPIHCSLPVSEFWQPGIGNSLLAVQAAVNEKLTDLCYVLRLQGFSVPVSKGSNTEISLLDPGRGLNLPADANFSFEAPNSPIKATLDSIDYLIKTTAISYGLPASYLSNKPSERKSGISRLIENKELQEKRQDDILLFEKYEKELFEIMRVINNYHNKDKISNNAEFNIHFAEPAQQSISEQAQSWTMLMDYNVLSPIDIIQKLNPELSRQEAEEKFQQNKNYSLPAQA